MQAFPGLSMLDSRGFQVRIAGSGQPEERGFHFQDAGNEDGRSFRLRR